MEKLYLLAAGALTGAAVGLLSGNLGCWLAAGIAMGAVLAVAARQRPPRPVEIEPADSGRPTAGRRS